MVFVTSSEALESARVDRIMALGVTFEARGLTYMATWTQWQSEVVLLLKRDFEEMLGHISIDEIDWPSWHNYYQQGRSPRSAIERALELDL